MSLADPRLHGRWTKENRLALEALLAREYDHPPIAALDWDNTCILGDIGNSAFHQLAEDLAFRFDAPGFGDWLTEADPDVRLISACERYQRDPTPENARALRFAFEYARGLLYDGMDDGAACAWDAGAFLGWDERAARAFAREVVQRELERPLTLEVLEAEGAQLEILRGIRVRPEMQELVDLMQQAGWQVWVISATAQWIVEPFAARFGVPAQRVIGMRRAVVNGCFSREVEPPVSFSDGKLDAYQRFIHPSRPPWLAAGDSPYDWKLIEWAEGARLLIEPTDARLREFALWQKSRGEPWLVQRFDEPRS